MTTDEPRVGAGAARAGSAARDSARGGHEARRIEGGREEVRFEAGRLAPAPWPGGRACGAGAFSCAPLGRPLPSAAPRRLREGANRGGGPPTFPLPPPLLRR